MQFDKKQRAASRNQVGSGPNRRDAMAAEIAFVNFLCVHRVCGWRCIGGLERFREILIDRSGATTEPREAFGVRAYSAAFPFPRAKLIVRPCHSSKSGGIRCTLHAFTAGKGESQRDSGPKPTVARNELPWVEGWQRFNPERVVAPCLSTRSHRAAATTLSGLASRLDLSPG